MDKVPSSIDVFKIFFIFSPEKAACTSAKPDKGNHILSDWE